MSVLVVGAVPPQRAGLDLLERLALDADACGKLLAGRRSTAPHVTEAVVLVDVQPGRDLRRRSSGSTAASRSVTAICSPSAPASPPRPGCRTSTCTTRTAPSRTCSRSRAGLDSMVVGESQILGQVKRRAAARPGGGASAGPQRPVPAGPAGRQARAHRDRHRPGGPVARQLSRSTTSSALTGALAGRRVTIIGAGRWRR